jgi:hypothetical protein
VGKTCTMQEDDQESTQHFRDQTWKEETTWRDSLKFILKK